MTRITVFIVDDHYMVIEGIRTLLHGEKDIELIGHAANASSCLSFLQSNQPDVILMDISMPDKSGVDLCKEVRSAYPSVFVIGLSTFNQFTFIDAMMENGASGYLLKNADKEEIIEAIHTVAKGKTYLSDEAASTLKNAAHEDSPVLTRRENEVLRLIAEGLSNPKIAEKLFLSLSTVDTHRKSLMRKLNIKNTALLIRYAMENNII
ncbi:MAG: response regulator transcription factor [Chitinophagaceae bacterium]|nr:response regulator transcription factor [Chitinophagaceae bacterium]